MDYILLLFICGCFYGAGIFRKVNKERRHHYTINPKEGNLSESIVELISFAGGIYLSLTLLMDFLSLTIAERVFLWGTSFDPIAGISIVLALLQPVYEHVRTKYT